MILNKKPLSFAEVLEEIKGHEGKEVLISYLKKFGKMSKKDAESLRNEILTLKNPKIKEENIIKIADFLPKSKEEMNKIFNEVSLNEEEINAMLEIAKKY